MWTWNTRAIEFKLNAFISQLGNVKTTQWLRDTETSHLWMHSNTFSHYSTLHTPKNLLTELHSTILAISAFQSRRFTNTKKKRKIMAEYEIFKIKNNFGSWSRYIRTDISHAVLNYSFALCENVFVDWLSHIFRSTIIVEDTTATNTFS